VSSTICLLLALSAGAPPGDASKEPSRAPAFETRYSRAADRALSEPETSVVAPFQYAPKRAYRPGRPVFRGQAPSTYDEGAAAGAVGGPATTYVPPGGVVPPPGGVYGADPFLGGGAPVDPYGGYGGAPSPGYGLVGPQPYQFGWSSRYDVGWLPMQQTDPNVGDLEMLEANAAWRHTSPGWGGTIFSWTPEVNFRALEGPGGVNLPGQLYRFASDFELATPANSPWSFQFGFTPAIVSDLQDNLNSDSYQFDGRAVGFYRASPEVMFALGFVVYDRVKDYVLPYAGVVWTPSPCWEFRLLFPKSRISYFLGDWGGTSAWLYTGVEFNVEAYSIDLAGPNGENEKIEFVDYRAVLGVRTESFGVSSFVEAGYIFGREANFLNGTPDFDIDNGFMVRGGLRF
jgi:hypothetical protein